MHLVPSFGMGVDGGPRGLDKSEAHDNQNHRRTRPKLTLYVRAERLSMRQWLALACSRGVTCW
jgi:hypothetical protein